MGLAKIFCCLPLSFALSGPGQEGTVIAAWWIHNGVDMCCVGYAEDKFLGHLDQLHGRICQVVELFHFSEDQDKKQKSMDKDGVCEVVLIDEPRPYDSRLNDVFAIGITSK